MQPEHFSRERLWEGCILGGIINAILCARSASYDLAREWTDDTYFLDIQDGREGLVFFEHGWRRPRDGCFIAMFFDPMSELGPQRVQAYDFGHFLAPMPRPQRELAIDVAKRCKLGDYKYNDTQAATAAIWANEGQPIQAIGSWDIAFRNGVYLISDELLGGTDASLKAWQQHYELSQFEISLAADLLRQRLLRLAGEIVLSETSVVKLRESAIDPALRSCRHHLSSLDIYFPPDFDP